MAKLKPPPDAPIMTIEAASATQFGEKAMGSSESPTTHPNMSAVFRAPKILTSQAVTGIITTEPTPRASSAYPNVAGMSSAESRMAGMRLAHVEKLNPSTKNTAQIAMNSNRSAFLLS